MHVAIVDEELPYPLNSGKRIRTFQLVSRLARRHRITYIFHRNADRQEAKTGRENLSRPRDRDDRRGACDTPKIRPCFLRATWGKSALSSALLSHISYQQAASTRDPRSGCKPGGGPLAGGMDPLHGVLAGCKRCPTADHGPQRRVANLAALLRERGRSCPTLVHRPPMAEVRAVRAACLSASRPHRLGQLRGCGADPRPVRGSTCGDRGERGRYEILPTRFFGANPRPDPLPGKPRLAAEPGCGQLLLSAIFPSVVAQDPSARLCLVGRSPPEALRRRVASTPGVELHADVPDVRPFLARKPR